jgi:hypothetical protein
VKVAVMLEKRAGERGLFWRCGGLLCTIHHLINFTLARVENVPVCPQCLTKDIGK